MSCSCKDLVDLGKYAICIDDFQAFSLRNFETFNSHFCMWCLDDEVDQINMDWLYS